MFYQGGFPNAVRLHSAFAPFVLQCGIELHTADEHTIDPV